MRRRGALPGASCLSSPAGAFPILLQSAMFLARWSPREAMFEGLPMPTASRPAFCRHAARPLSKKYPSTSEGSRAALPARPSLRKQLKGDARPLDALHRRGLESGQASRHLGSEPRQPRTGSMTPKPGHAIPSHTNLALCVARPAKPLLVSWRLWLLPSGRWGSNGNKCCSCTCLPAVDTVHRCLAGRWSPWQCWPGPVSSAKPDRAAPRHPTNTFTMSQRSDICASGRGGAHVPPAP